jgi:hypothetical protein
LTLKFGNQEWRLQRNGVKSAYRPRLSRALAQRAGIQLFDRRTSPIGSLAKRARYAVPRLPRSLAARMREALGHTCTHCVQCGVTAALGASSVALLPSRITLEGAFYFVCPCRLIDLYFTQPFHLPPESS